MNKSTLKQIIREELEKAQQTVDIYKNNYIRGIQSIIKQNPEAQNFVGKELIKMDKESLKDLTAKEAMKLNTLLLQTFKKSTTPQTSTDYNPYDMPSGRPSGNWTGD
jgi:CHASE3 domain sensor protein